MALQAFGVPFEEFRCLEPTSTLIGRAELKSSLKNKRLDGEYIFCSLIEAHIPGKGIEL